MISLETARQLLSPHGDTRPQLPSDWSGDFPLPEAVLQIYDGVGPVDVTIEGPANPIFLPALRNLWDFQAGYRWNGLTGEPIADWPIDWLVVASEGGDPFIVERSTGRILHARHGEGEWSPEPLFRDLPSMIACLAALGTVVLDAGDDFLEEDCSIREKYQLEAFERVQSLLGSRRESQAVVGTLGWT